MYLIPSGNNKKTSETSKTIKIMITVSTVSALVSTSCAHSPPSAYERYHPLVEKTLKDEKSTTISKAIFHEVNSIRKEHGLDTLEWDDELERFAISHSVEMGVNGYFSHDDYTGRNLSQRAEILFIRFNMITENCGVQEFAVGPNIKPYPILETVHAIVEGWMKSEGHREHILDSTVTVTGVGTYIISDTVCYTIKKDENVEKCYRIYVTQDFAKPIELINYSK